MPLLVPDAVNVNISLCSTWSHRDYNASSSLARS